MKLKVMQTLYSGLGGHSSVAFSLLDSSFGNHFTNYLVFYGIEHLSLFSQKKLQENKIKFSFIKKKPKRYLSPLLSFYRILKVETPDTLIIHNSELIYPAVVYKKIKKDIKILFVEHQHNQTKTKLQWIVSKYALKNADTVICLNELYKKEMLKELNLTKLSNKVKIIPNGINVKKFSGAEKDKLKYLGMASRLTDNRDHKLLLAAFKQLSDEFPFLVLKIAGTGDQENVIKNLINKYDLEDKVEMLGLLNETEMVKFYRSLSFYVHSTLAETLSTSLLQAMACELPVITSDIKNNKQLIKDNENGYLYKNKDTDDLYQKMKYAVNNFEEAKGIGRAARIDVVENYSNETMGRKYLKLIK